MKKYERGILLFLVLVLALSSGASYLALYHASKNQKHKEDQKMTVALVNEDQGAKFNGETYDFGTEFIKNIEKDDKHNWYVVSRGVAESGLQRNAYNMMIVIPNDFTKKALSINSKAPERVALNYKVNVSGNNNMKVKAEKTASSILGEFNRRIIDVYFASVIGNLQEAQDNISSIVNKEQVYTNVYTNAIHRPLAGYATQFGAVQASTQVSKDGFKGIQDILKEFENNLGEGAKISKTYQNSMLDYAKMTAANTLLQKGFSDQLGYLDRDMNNGDVLQQLDQLVAANNEINKQFQLKDTQTANIMTEASALQKYLTTTKEKVDKLDTELTTTLASDMQKSIAEKLKKEMKTNAGEEQEINLNKFFMMPDKMSRKNLRDQMKQLPPPLTTDDLLKLGITEPKRTEINKLFNNVIAVNEKYKREFNDYPDSSAPLPDNLNNFLLTNEATISDSVILPKNPKEAQEFSLFVPKEYKVNEVSLTLPNMQVIEMKEFPEKNTIILPATDEGIFTVKLKVQPNNTDKSIDFFQPIKWKWKMHQKNVKDVDIPEPPKESAPPLGQSSKESRTDKVVLPKSGVQSAETSNNENINKENESKQDSVEPDQKDENVTSESSNKQESMEENKGKESESGIDEKDNKDNEENKNENNDKEDKEEPEDPNDKPIEKVEVENNYITHSVMSSLTDYSIGEIMMDVNDVMSSYQKMSTLYNNYFGLDISKLADQLNQMNLSDMATTDSLFYLFNKQDIVDVIANFVADQITEEVRKDTEELQSKIKAYIDLVTNAEQNSQEMERLIKQTTEQAKILNTNLTKTLLNLSTWREASLKLQNEQTKILTNNDQEQTAILSLDGEFNSLLTVSQSLANQSKGNLNTVNNVYKTFDAIDNQANEIKNSGSHLVKQASNLSNNLTNKLSEDQKFANNFANVLANSRIGERQNENLLDFLSNPVETKTDGIIVAGDIFTPYFIVLICFIVALFTAYVISNHERKHLQTDTFKSEMTLVRGNLPITIITASVGIVEGILTGLLSGYLLEIVEGKFMLWIGLITIIMVTMLLVATYLLRQLKMFGMFLLLASLSLYLFLTEALGLHFDKMSIAAKIKEFSPLQYIEKLVMGFADRAADNQSIIICLFAIIVISLVGHLFVLNRFGKSEEKEDETISEAL
ncbi:type VII secretion protein EsaA [Heyndrickxia sporothermodurans]|uniref:type VII secretion protein EsaA n=1 Tax=Heyndrickxia sporothermodurans TaxID=46224 RepID=UPI0035DB14BA